MTNTPLCEFTQTLRKTFARYGFIECPLDYAALKSLWHYGVDEGTAYGVGCDIAAGYTFDEALKANLFGGDE